MNQPLGTGMSRPLDCLGRMVIPMELRRAFNLQPGDRMELLPNTADGSITVKKFEAGCTICGSAEDLHQMQGSEKVICDKCIGSIK